MRESKLKAHEGLSVYKKIIYDLINSLSSKNKYSQLHVTINHSSIKYIIEFISISQDYFDFVSSNTCIRIKMMIIEIL